MVSGLAVALLVFVFILIIVYVLVLFELYKRQLWIFAPYVPPPPPEPYFYPLGSVRPLTQEEIDQRNAVINASVGR